MLTRRQLLTRAALLSWVSALGGRADAGCPLVLPSSPEFDGLCRWFNPAVSWRPRVFALPRTDAEVVEALQQARSQGLRVAVRCGGHSYIGLSGSEGMVLDVSSLHDFRVRSDGLVEVGAGWRLGPLMNRLADRRLVLPLGSCPGVGVSGFLLGGGYGLLSRALGLGCDRVVDATLVSPARGVLRARSEPELLWGLQGAGFGQFGVVTRWLLRPAALQQVVLFRRVYPLQALSRVVPAWLAWAPRADARLTSFLSMIGGRAPGLTVGGLFRGRLSSWKALCPGWPGAEESWDRECDHLEAMASVAGHSAHASPAFAATSDFVDRPLTPRALQALPGLLATPGCQITLDAYGGAIRSGPGAFAHRASLACVQAICYRNLSQPQARADEWVQRYRAQVGRSLSGRAYANYPELHRANWQQAYFGSAWPRLVDLKRRHDPEGLLHHSLSIGS